MRRLETSRLIWICTFHFCYWFLNWNPIFNDGTVQIQSWKKPFEKGLSSILCDTDYNIVTALCLSCFLSYRCALWVLSDTMITSLGKREHVSIMKTRLSNILKILQLKQENFQIKNSSIFHIPAQNIDCGYSLEPPCCPLYFVYLLLSLVG